MAGSPASLQGEPRAAPGRGASARTPSSWWRRSARRRCGSRSSTNTSSCWTRISRPTVVCGRSSSSARIVLENGIAEQDMVSAAAGLARHGLLPIVNSFASFLASRANEQIYNQASERSKVVYALHYAGLIPAGPEVHQSIRDVSLLGALPNVTVVHPGNGARRGPCSAGPSRSRTRASPSASRSARRPFARPRRHDRPRAWDAAPRRGGRAADRGPVMLAEAMGAAERLSEEGVSLAVVAMPWLNRIDGEWAAELVERYPEVHVLEDHAPVGALGDALLRALQPGGSLEGRPLRVLGVEGGRRAARRPRRWPTTGSTPPRWRRASARLSRPVKPGESRSDADRTDARGRPCGPWCLTTLVVNHH